MFAEPRIVIEIPESVIDAVEDALRRHLDVMKQYEAQDRDRADRVSWAVKGGPISGRRGGVKPGHGLRTA